MLSQEARHGVGLCGVGDCQHYFEDLHIIHLTGAKERRKTSNMAKIKIKARGRIALQLPDDLNDWLRQQAEFRMVSKSALVRMALADYAQRQGKAA